MLSQGDCSSVLRLTPGCACVSQYRFPYLIGLTKALPSRLFQFIIWVLICVICVVLHRYILICKGVWDESEEKLGDPILLKPLDDVSVLSSFSELMRTALTIELFAILNLQSVVPSTFWGKLWAYVPSPIRNYYFKIIPRPKYVYSFYLLISLGSFSSDLRDVCLCVLL